MTDLVTTSREAALTSVARARQALAEISDLEIAKDFSDRAAAAIAYFRRAKDTRDLALEAMQVRLWAERRAGWILLEDGVEETFCSDLARSLGTTSQTLRRWMNFARAEEKMFASVLDEIVVRGGELAVGTIERRLQTKNLERVERGIYTNYLGKFVLRWRRHGTSHQVTVGTDLPAARHHLLVVTGKIAAQEKKAKERRPFDEVVDAYASVRSILQALDRVHPRLSPQVRKQVEEACMGLYRAEDALGQAVKVTS